MSDVLSKEGITRLMLGGAGPGIEVLAVTHSTNSVAMERALRGAAHGAVILAESQTSGRGQRGRSFFSPPGCGLYMSFVLHTARLGFANPTAVTAYAAVCVCDVLEALGGLRASVKWVNDVFCNGKKVCGILTEAAAAGGTIAAVVPGIGINVSTPDDGFPEEIRGIAGSLYPNGGQPFTRNELAAALITKIALEDAPPQPEVFDRYRARLFMLGSRVTVREGGEAYAARAVDIDGAGRLIVERRDGTRKALVRGEIGNIANTL